MIGWDTAGSSSRTSSGEKHLQHDTLIAPKIEAVAVALEALLRGPDEEAAVTGYQPRLAGLRKEVAVTFEYPVSENPKGLGDGLGLRRFRGLDIFGEPRGQRPGVAKVKRKRMPFVEVHPRQLPQQVRHREVNIAAEIAGCAEGTTGPWLVACQDGHPEAGFQQL